jgi:hypothetical protein
MAGKKFFQADVAESSSGSIWTGPVIFAESYAEAEFHTLLELQKDWGDQYMTDGFLETFGRLTDEDDESVERDDPVFPGKDAWNAGDYWTDECGGEVVMSMLTLSPLEALAQLGKIECRLNDTQIEQIMADKVVATLTIMPLMRA